jgi:class 3 adenylate cyclase
MPDVSVGHAPAVELHRRRTVVSLLPTGVATLLLAHIKGSTQLWDTQPDEMSAAIALLDRKAGRARRCR